MPTLAPEIQHTAPSAANAEPPVPFGSNELRLSAREWLIALGLVATFMIAMPRLWKKAEPFAINADYRIPYALSKDYWLYQRRLEQDAQPGKVLILGDSVVWGEYVRPDGTLSHFLNQQTGRPGRFVNCGVNGLFPLAMEGLVKDYGSAIHNMKVIVHCNVLWMTSPRADLSEPKPQSFNHSRLVPQFFPPVPSYDADANERLSATLDRHLPFFAWAGHLQNAYYDQKSIPRWTLEDDGNTPPRYPNAWRNPLGPLHDGIPAEPANDPDRGPRSRRHKPWNAAGGEPASFEWIDLETSLQWQAFRRVVKLLRARGNDVLVIVGPFNEHMIVPDQRPAYLSMRGRIVGWLSQNHFPVLAPATLDSDLYADDSHPLTRGYARLAEELDQDPRFGNWLRTDEFPVK